ncbi:MAG: Rrf2 family transcriptional regulator [Verrucomicrobia bacterium]|nr:MAG: Rrf2 family transcriptional regulator [Verrucomicrobiota bacterium]
MLSKKAKYAIRALIHLGQKGSGKPVLIRDIAVQERLPQKFLEAILLEMKSAGILAARPGKGGGYSLRQPADTINMGRVIRLIDGPLAPIPCVSQTAYAPCDDCLDEKTCTIRLVMKQVRDATAKILDETTLAQLLEQQERLSGAGSALDFAI